MGFYFISCAVQFLFEWVGFLLLMMKVGWQWGAGQSWCSSLHLEGWKTNLGGENNLVMAHS